MNKNKGIYPIPSKLFGYDLLIEIAHIKHVSVKMKQTGRVSEKTQKKWHSRFNRFLRRISCVGGCKRFMPKTDADLFEDGRTFWWTCPSCGCVTAWVWEDEVSEPLAKSYPQHIKRRCDFDNEEDAAFPDGPA